MTKCEFIKTYSDLIANGRKRNFPDMRPSEEAVSRMGDDKRAASLWRKYREHYSKLTPAQFVTELDAKEGEGS